MAMPVTPEARRYTVEEVLEFPSDGNRYEVVGGILLVSPAPRLRHQVIISRLVHSLRDYLKPLGLADSVLTAPADITWGLPPREAEDLVQPDVFVVSPMAPGSNWVDVKRLELIAEILSPSNTRGDRVIKRLTYQRHGVPTYWVVDDEAQLVEVWHSADERPAIVTDALRWSFRDAEIALTISLAELFAP